MKNVLFFGLLIVLGLSSCKSESDSDIRAQAKESLENKTVVEPGAQGMMTAETAGSQTAGPMTTIEFESKRFDFGTITSGDKATTIFKFTNTGNEPLLISDVKASCGCTASKYPREPVAPGESAEIEAVFDSSGKSGAQTKNVTVMTNTDPSSHVLILEGNVEKK
ncbi:DUF1573 domain-containing protein [Membranicola marinus]|uniref:DUF1573 domain-containing protein n=1 Tax=Membranihabitans marinus TaxID=1227546 RepID=A0A953HUV4_9BACT|nr:DUF1573 domain-containing protein [Membranihabitans marinus]MBY5958880.1 DUF1573 domain-containing protein [Membranihabitans marinus]